MSRPGDPGRTIEESSRGLFRMCVDLKNEHTRQKSLGSHSYKAVFQPYGHNIRLPQPAFQNVANTLYARQIVRGFVHGKGASAVPGSSVTRNKYSIHSRLHGEPQPDRPKDPGVRRI